MEKGCSIPLPPGNFGRAGAGVLIILMAAGAASSQSTDAVLLPALSTISSSTEPTPSTALRVGRGTNRWARRLVASLHSPFRPVDEISEVAYDGVIRLLPSRHYLPDHLREELHWDYPWPFHWIPRRWTTFDWGKPEMILGNQQSREAGSPKPIGERGSFQLSRYPDLPVPLSWVPLYLAFTTPGGTHLRLGARWDDVDAYTQFPSVAIKRLNKKRTPRAPPPRPQ